MKNKMVKILSSFALAAVLTCTGVAAQADEVMNTMTVEETLNIYCSTNDDSEFPFYTALDVMPESIQYINLEKPIYGFESVLDDNKLDFNVNFSLKDEYNNFDSYDFQVFNADYSKTLVSESLKNDDVLTLHELSLGTEYKINMTLQSDNLTANYVGQFTIQAELDGTLVIDLFYQNLSNNNCMFV